MKTIKKIAAVILVFIMALTAVGCHPKDEIAVTINDYEFTSAYYMCALINAYSDGQSEVYNNLSSEEQESGKEIDYFSKKIDDKDFETWVKDRTIEILKEVSYYKTVCKENKLEISEGDISASKYYASVLWESLKGFFEPNGVSLTTFTQYVTDGASSSLIDYYLSYMGVSLNDYKELYFGHLYGEGGKKEITKKDIKKQLYDNYILADVLEVNFENNESDEERAEVKKQFEKYVKDLKKGKKTFEEVHKDYYKDEEEIHDHSTQKDGPKDAYATLLDISSSEYFADIKKMDIDDVKLFENEYKTNYTLVVKKNLKDDDYYLKTLDLSLRHIIKDAELNKETESKLKDIKVEIDDYAVDRFEVDEIIEPEYS